MGCLSTRGYQMTTLDKENLKKFEAIINDVKMGHCDMYHAAVRVLKLAQIPEAPTQNEIDTMMSDIGSLVRVPFQVSRGLETAKRLRAHIVAQQAEVERLREALEDADRFITNGIEHGFITMPDVGDPATETPGIIKAAIACGKGE